MKGMAGTTGLEPAASAVTVTRNQLKRRDTGGSQRTFQNAEKELLDHNCEHRSFTVVEASQV